MCGIAGFYGKGQIEDGRRMIETIAYRGPDFHDVRMEGNVCMAHARLSIIDLSESANQPMYNAKNNLCIVFNGEIYNYQILKEGLRKTHGVEFKTSSDTEVLLALYELHGKEMLSELNGMFAFAIYDLDKKEIFIARDRMGKKPLYYTSAPDAFVFGSEI